MKEWADAKALIGGTRVTLGPQASQQWLRQPDHLAMVLSRYRAAAALIGDAERVVELGCGEGIGAGILARGRTSYAGYDADVAALQHAVTQHGSSTVGFQLVDLVTLYDADVQRGADAVVSLDVIEHIPQDEEALFMRGAVGMVSSSQLGVCVIGTPSANAYHLASPQSKAGHVNNFTPERLKALMQQHFHRVQLMGMQDTAVHFGHPGMMHYLLAVGIGPR